MDAMQPSSSLELDLNVTGRSRPDTGPEAFIAKSIPAHGHSAGAELYQRRLPVGGGS